MPDTIIDRHSDLIDALAARKNELGLSNAFVEAALHVGENNLDKILGPSRAKRMTVATAFDLAMLMGCRITLTVDPELEARMRGKWEQRDGKKVHPAKRIGRVVMERAKPIFHQLLGAAGGHARARCLPAKQRKEIARTAAHSRWRLHRAAVKARAVAGAASP